MKAHSVKKPAEKLPLGRAVAQYRLRAGLGRKELQAQLGFRGNYFAKVENGFRTPSVASLVRICEAMGVEAWRVLRRAQRMATVKETAKR